MYPLWHALTHTHMHICTQYDISEHTHTHSDTRKVWLRSRRLRRIKLALWSSTVGNKMEQVLIIEDRKRYATTLWCCQWNIKKALRNRTHQSVMATLPCQCWFRAFSRVFFWCTVLSTSLWQGKPNENTPKAWLLGQGRWSYLPKLTCEEAQAEMDEALKAIRTWGWARFFWGGFEAEKMVI